MKIFFAALAALVLLLFLPFLFPSFFALTQDVPPPLASDELPWRIIPDEQGNSKVFGLTLGAATLADALQRFGDAPELAVLIAANTPQGKEAQDATREAYYSQINLGFLQGRLILTLATTPETLALLLARASKGEYLGNGSRKFTLAPEDVGRALRLPLAALTLIPNANLDAEVIAARFGEPAIILPMGDTLRHYLYPDQGLDIVLDAKGKEVLQYVPPRDFARRVQAPLSF
jgi:hypothetical protein